MSGYRGRTGPNFSEYLHNLNSMTSPYEQDQFGADDLELNQDLAMFTNTDFTHFDMDMPPLSDDGGFAFDMGEAKSGSSVKYEDLLSAPEPAQQTFSTPALGSAAAEPSQFYGTYNTPIQPAPPHSFHGGDAHAAQPPVPSPTVPAARRKVESEASPLNAEEQSRMAAEEDKRRRNTAASARFRVKKKQREQALEKTVKEVQDKNAQLEARLAQLETENTWLKDLITEKNGVRSQEEMARAYQEYRKESEERDLKAHEHTTGVGTR